MPVTAWPPDNSPATATSSRLVAPAESLVRNSVYLMAATIVTSVVGYAFWVVAARLYSTAAIGEAGAGVSAMAFASLLGAVGGSSAIIAELPNKRRPYDWSIT